MCSLDRPDQSDSSPHVHVSIQRARVRHLIFGGGDAQDGLQVTCLPKDPSLWSQSIPAQCPELRAHTRMLGTHFNTRTSRFLQNLQKQNQP